MVQINYVDGDSEVIEVVTNNVYCGFFRYDDEEECFVVFDKSNYMDCMRIPREFVKSIRVIKVE